MAREQGSWATRYPDLAGKTVILAGDSGHLADVAVALAGNGVLLAIVAPDRAVVEAAITVAEAADAVVFGVTADPASTAVWVRVASHIEQRLGPIDVVVSIATPGAREVIAAALMPDMAARRRGVLVEAGADVTSRPMPAGMRHRAITGGSFTAQDLSASVLLCASDTLTTAALVMTAGQPPG